MVFFIASISRELLEDFSLCMEFQRFLHHIFKNSISHRLFEETEYS